MKIFTLALCASLLGGATALAGPKLPQSNPTAPANALRALAPGKSLHRAAAGSTKWLPTSVVIYSWDNYEGWMLDDEVTSTYTADGRLETEITKNADGYVKLTYGYTPGHELFASRLNQVSTDGTTYTNSVNTVREFDSVLTNLVTSNEEFMWMGGAWSQNGNNFHRTITRDAAGNITEVEIAVLYQGVFDPTQRLIIEYTDGVASSIVEVLKEYDYENDKYVWTTGVGYTDIVWDRTDGQIYDTGNLTYGANRMASCTLMNYGEPVGTMEYTYNGDESYVGRMMMDGQLVSTINFTFEENNGYTSETVEDYYGTEIKIVESELYDEYGQMLLQEFAEYYDGEESYFEKVIGTVTYGNVYPLEYVQTTIYTDLEESDNVLKIEYLDYIEHTSDAATIEADENAPVEYFNLQGIRVDQPSDGIFIRRQGTKAEKVLVK